MPVLAAQFHRLLRVMISTFDVPAVWISVIKGQTEQFKYQIGWMQTEMPLESSLARFVIAQQQPIIFEDMTRVPTLKNHPMTHNWLKFYAAHPLYDANGTLFGVLSLGDYRPNHFDHNQQRQLADFARYVEREYNAHHRPTGTASVAPPPRPTRKPDGDKTLILPKLPQNKCQSS